MCVDKPRYNLPLYQEYCEQAARWFIIVCDEHHGMGSAAIYRTEDAAKDKCQTMNSVHREEDVNYYMVVEIE